MRKLKLDELGRLTEAEFKAIDKIPIVVVLDNIRSGHNVGAIFRTGDAFAIERVVLTGFTPRPPHKEIHKTAIGASSSVDWIYQPDIEPVLMSLKKDGYLILGIEQTDESIALSDYQVPDESKVVLVLGNEVSGISDEALPLIDQAIEINQYGTKHSLNVSVCGGIVIHHFSEKLR